MMNLPIQWHLEADGTFLVTYTYSGFQLMASLQVGCHGSYLMNLKNEDHQYKNHTLFHRSKENTSHSMID
jgi:hypothetical protein